MGRINLFLKGNLDLRDSLHSLRVNGHIKWNGVNEIIRNRFPGTTARLQHETFTRSDALLQARGLVPGKLNERHLQLASYPVVSQFSAEVFETKADVIIFSLLPDITTSLMRHKEDGYLFFAGETADWSGDDRGWLKAEFQPSARLNIEASMDNFSKIINRCREKSQAPILIYNFSSIISSDTLHCHRGLEDILSTRIKRFNLALIDLSQQTGISIVDVDAILARHGADRLKIDALHLNAEGCRLVAEEVVRILEDVGCMERSQ